MMREKSSYIILFIVCCYIVEEGINPRGNSHIKKDSNFEKNPGDGSALWVWLKIFHR